MSAAGPPDGTIAYHASRRWPLVSASIAVLVAIALGHLIVVRERGLPFGIDTAWMNEIVEHRSPFWLVPALVMNSLGGGLLGSVIIPLAIAAALVIWRGRWAAGYYAIAASASAIVVQVLKNVIGRSRPMDILVSADFGSFPSGHSANAATTVVVLAILLPLWSVRIAGAAYVVVMMVSRTYLGAHWLSDTIGGLLLGVGVALIVWAPFATRLHAERIAAPPPLWRRLADRRRR